MKDYELLSIVSGGLAEAEATKVSDDVGNALAKLGGKAEEDTVWGRRRLAYEIGKDDHGWYVITRFSMDPAKVDEFQKALNLNAKVIRTVLVNASEVPTPEEAAKAKADAERSDSDRGSSEDAPKAPAAVAAPTDDTGDVPEEMKKSVKKVVTKPEAKPADEAEAPKQAEPAADDKDRQAQLDEKLGEILND
ncbi:30S ribosomal protein S6 [Patescibacteria group bacterium]|nr:30S ribosomal protein S6 [Patescibacteria group bacterium]